MFENWNGAALCYVENSRGTDGEPQRSSSKTAESTPRWDWAETEKPRPTQRVCDWSLIIITDH